MLCLVEAALSLFLFQTKNLWKRTNIYLYTRAHTHTHTRVHWQTDVLWSSAVLQIDGFQTGVGNGLAQSVYTHLWSVELNTHNKRSWDNDQVTNGIPGYQ